MWDIYHRAHLVVAWLGEQYENFKDGLEILDRVGSVAESNLGELNSSSGATSGDQALCMTGLGKLGLPSFFSEQWDPLFNILTLPWFSRVWVIQELMASKACVFLYGSDIIESSRILRIGQIFDESKLLSSLRNFSRNRVLAANVASLAALKWGKNRTDLLELLWSTHLFRATNPRDRVFALLNMAQSLDSGMVSDLIDYKLNPHEVLNRTARLCLRQGTLDVLSYAQAFGDLYSLPSWVPHWNASDYSYSPMIRVLESDFLERPTAQVEISFESEGKVRCKTPLQNQY